jgi:acyl-CoA thioester hydrolase
MRSSPQKAGSTKPYFYGNPGGRSIANKPLKAKMLRQHEIEIRVRYHDTDAQGRVHHGAYINYFEIGRVELLRASGRSYKSLEDEGIMLVVADLKVQYYLPAIYDDLLTLHTETLKAKGARILHGYRLTRGDDLIVEGETTVACVSREGKIQRLPEWLRDQKLDIEPKSGIAED